MFLDSDSLIDFSFTYGIFDLAVFAVTATNFAVRYKSFLGNSFYWRVGPGLRQYQIKDRLGSIFSDREELDSTGTVLSFGADVGIGNQWQFETFTLGCDWVGYYFPVSVLSKRYDAPENAKPEDIKSSEDELTDLVRLAIFNFLGFISAHLFNFFVAAKKFAWEDIFIFNTKHPY